MKSGDYFAIVRRGEIATLPISIAGRTELAIRTFAFDRGVAQVSYGTLAEIVSCDRKNMPRVVRSLEARGRLKIVRGDPRGNHYLLPVGEGRGVLNGEDGGVLNGEDRGVLNSEDRGVLNTEDPIERIEIQKTPPLGGGRTRARGAPPSPGVGGGGSKSRQGNLLLPVNGTGKRQADSGGHRQRACDIAAYQPSPEVLAWALDEYDLDTARVTSDGLLGAFKDYYASRVPPRDLDSAFRSWIRHEWKFTAAAANAPQPQRQRSSTSDALARAASLNPARFEAG
jgi:hypothetical protein